jgi:hypothetical protein
MAVGAVGGSGVGEASLPQGITVGWRHAECKRVVLAREEE